MRTNNPRKTGPLSDTQGKTTIEYILILCLLALLAFGANKSLGGSLTARVNEATDTIAQLPGEPRELPGEEGFGINVHSRIGVRLPSGDTACTEHVAEGGADGAPCDPRSFGTCSDGSRAVTCDPATGVTVSNPR